MENLTLPILISISVAVAVLLLLYIRLISKHSQLKTALEASTIMEQHLRDEQFEQRMERQRLADQIKSLTQELATAQQDLIMIKRQNDTQSARLREKNHQLTEQTKQLEIEQERLQEEKTAVETDFVHANGRWKQERVRFEDELTQIREELDQVKKEDTPAIDVNSRELEKWQEQCRTLQTQQEKLQNFNKALQDKLNSQSQWSTQIQQTLESEIAQLIEQLEQAQQATAK